MSFAPNQSLSQMTQAPQGVSQQSTPQGVSQQSTPQGYQPGLLSKIDVALYNQGQAFRKVSDDTAAKYKKIKDDTAIRYKQAKANALSKRYPLIVAFVVACVVVFLILIFSNLDKVPEYVGVSFLVNAVWLAIAVPMYISLRKADGTWSKKH